VQLATGGFEIFVYLAVTHVLANPKNAKARNYLVRGLPSKRDFLIKSEFVSRRRFVPNYDDPVCAQQINERLEGIKKADHELRADLAQYLPLEPEHDRGQESRSVDELDSFKENSATGASGVVSDLRRKTEPTSRKPKSYQLDKPSLDS
jgi:hypothetical protein